MAFGPLTSFFTSLYAPNQGTIPPSQAWKGIDGAAQVTFPQRLRDVVGKQKVSQSQNIYDADFEYGMQPLRWENFIAGSGTITPAPGLGGVQMNLTTSSGDITIRQSRPYHRYQPGKSLYMASNVNFGTTQANQQQRVGFFDDGNGIFFLQSGASTTANPYGMNVVVRSDSQGTAGGVPVDTVIPVSAWNGDQALIQSINWSRVQMIWMEYAWYGAGALRWGVVINGEPYVVHQIGTGNSSFTGSGQVNPWSRTGNLPVRYEQRNTGVTATSNTMTHYGVSVLVEGGLDNQRGFTYSYGMSLANPTRTIPTNAVRYPIMSFRMRPMGQVTQDQSFNYSGANVPTAAANNAFSSGTTTTLTTTGASMTASAYVGRMLYYQAKPGGAANTITAAVVADASATGTIVGTTLNITGAVTNLFYVGMTITGGTTAANTYIIGQLTGTPGGTGTYSVSVSQTVGSATLTGAGAAVTLTFTSAHNLIANGPSTTASQAGDVLTLSGFSTTGTIAANGVYPVVSVPSSTTAVIKLGYGVSKTAIGTITAGNVAAAYTARITANTTTVITFQDVVTGGVMANAPTGNYQIGLIDRGQLLPQTLLLNSTAVCIVELIASTPTAEVGLTGSNFQPLSGLGSFNSFAERDVTATSMSGGEVVYAFPSPINGLQQLDLSFFFPLLTSIKGNIPDVLTLAVTTGASNPIISTNVICAEAMS